MECWAQSGSDNIQYAVRSNCRCTSSHNRAVKRITLTACLARSRVHTAMLPMQRQKTLSCSRKARAPQPQGHLAGSRRRHTPAGCTASASANGASTSTSGSPRRRAVVVGGGWAGFGAALALAKAGAEVVVLEAGANPGGLSSASKTSKGRVVEPGIKGFWMQYANIESLVQQELGINPSPFTPWTSSSFYSPQGLQVTSPIFQNLPRLPAPFGTLVHTAPYFTRLPLLDRLSAAPLVRALLEHDADEEAYCKYDTMSAFELFRESGVTRELYEQFLAPMLLVTLFAPPEELSAAAALGALNYFVLAHQADFDVRWCRGPIGELIFGPLVQRLEALGAKVLAGRRVKEVLPGMSTSTSQRSGADGGNRSYSVATSVTDGADEVWEADAVVFAVGVQAMQGIVRASPLLAASQDMRAVNNLSTVDVMAARLWVDRRVTPRTPSNVVAGFDDGVGGTFFDLNVLQDQYASEPHSVVEIDLYHASTLLPLSDDDLIARLLGTYLAAADPRYAEAKVTDAYIPRFRGAVTKFAPGSHASLPETVISGLTGVFMAGDWVRQGPGTHGAKGLSQEKAYVTGLQAGNAAARHLGLEPDMPVIAVEEDEPHIAVAKGAVQTARRLGLR